MKTYKKLTNPPTPPPPKKTQSHLFWQVFSRDHLFTEIWIETISKGGNGSPLSIVSRWCILTHMDLQQKETTHPKTPKQKHGTGRFTYIHVPYKLSPMWVNRPITWIHEKQPCFISSVGHMESPKNQTLFPTSLCLPSACCPPRTKCMAGICASGFTRWTCKNAHDGSLRTHPRRMGCIRNRSRIPSQKLTVRPWKVGLAKRSKSSPKKPVLLNGHCVSFKEFIPRKNKGIWKLKSYNYIWYFYLPQDDYAMEI